MAADPFAKKFENLNLSDSTEDTRVDAADQRGDDSVKQEGNDSANQKGDDSVDEKGDDSVDEKGDDSVDEKGDDSVNQKGVDSVDQRGRDSTDHGETGAVAEAAAPGFSQDTGPNDQSQNTNIPPTPSDQSTQGARGFVTCGNQLCQTCKIALPGVTFKDYNGTEHNINGTFNCTSQSVVYVICCKNCGKQYVGKSNELFHDRIQRHNDQLVDQHFNQGICGHGDKRCFVIEHVSESVALKERRKYWKETLKTYKPNGLNKR